jgi:hypothetical protein
VRGRRGRSRSIAWGHSLESSPVPTPQKARPPWEGLVDSAIKPVEERRFAGLSCAR